MTISPQIFFLPHISPSMFTGGKPYNISYLVLLFIILNAHCAIGSSTISPRQSLSGNQTIVSAGNNFELGFFTPGNSSNKHYIGIWYKRISEKTVVWVANRETPVEDPYSSELKISKDGNLVLIDHSKVLIWSTGLSPLTSGTGSNIAVLLDTGNLVLRNSLNSSTLIWQSFDHPTNTFLPGSHLGINKITGEYQVLTSWRNREDPSLGLFSERLDPESNQYVLLWNQTVRYWSSGEWNGHFFSLVPEMGTNHLLNVSFTQNNQSEFFTYTTFDSSFITRNVIDSSGKLMTFAWNHNNQQWMLYWSQPLAPCDVYSLCGSFGVCDRKSSPVCRCLHGFNPESLKDWELDNWSGGCVRKTPLNCRSNISNRKEEDGFLMLTNMKLPANLNALAVGSVADCELACSDHCSCIAYAYVDTCLMWTGELRNLEQLSNGDINATTLYLRLASSDMPKQSSNREMAIILTVIVVATLILAAIICSMLWFTGRCSWPRSRSKAAHKPIAHFTYANLQNMTKNFSEKLGKGSFGSVFKGVMPDSTIIAVKKLEGLRQGEKQFRTEVMTLGTIHHVNLVHLRGFCSEKAKRLLVYDYMPNGSLDSHLFKNDTNVLGWPARYQIILGVARGLSYMHEKCRECIIHCDIKPENILLDLEFSPKIADFGLAKLVGRDFSRVLTSMRGTIGYLAPEWISGLAITTKVDVYSFGMLVLEIISGRRNLEQSEEDINFFPLWAATKVNEGDYVCLLDQKLDKNADMEELSRTCRVACWCIQDSELDRPSMGLVVQALEGLQEVNVPPVPRALQQLMEYPSSSPPSKSSHI